MRVWIALALVTAGLLAFASARLGLRSDVTHFLPDHAAGRGAVVRALADAPLTRAMVVSLGADDPLRARAAARELARALGGHPEVARIRIGPDPELARGLYELYFEHRLAFLSDDPEEIATLTSDEAFRARAREARRHLSAAGGSALADLVVRDPLGAFERVVERVRGTDPGLRVEGGQFVSRDGDHALVLIQTRPPAFDTARQAPLLDALNGAAERIAAHAPDAEIVVEASGINRFAVRIEERVRRDTLRIAAISVGGLALLFLGLLRSPRLLVLAFLPSVLGVLAAVCVGIVVLGDLDVLTLAFGACLTGVAIDYAIHLVTHQGLARGAVAFRETARRLRPTIALGALTTMASFAGLAITDFPGFREIGLLAVTGVGVAVVVALSVLPALPGEHRASPLAASLAAALERASRRMSTSRRAAPVALALCVGVAALGLPQLRWTDDLRGLSELDPALRAEDARVRERLSLFDTSRLVLLRADDEQAALARNAELAARLDAAVARGLLEGHRSLHALLWPEALQRRNDEALRADPTLPDRLEAAFVAEGFRPGALAPFRDTLAAPAPEPLRLVDLEGAPLAPLVDSLVLPVDHGIALVTWLRGVRSERAIAEAVSEVPGAAVFDQTGLLDDLFGEFRATTLRQMAVGTVFVVLVLAVRYRRVRPVLAALLPSTGAVLVLLGALGLAGVEANLLHAVSLLLVLGIGVDYGIFVVDARSRHDLAATLLSLLVSCATTVFVFGTLALSAHPALRAIGVTTGAGVALSFLLAPIARALVSGPPHFPPE